MKYGRSEMIYRDYRWPRNESRVQVKEAVPFYPWDGNLILYLINLLTRNIFDGTILEIIIHDYIPKSIATLNQAIEWIKEKGESYYKFVLRKIAHSE